MEQHPCSNLEKKYIRLYIVTLIINLYEEYIMINIGLDEAQAVINTTGRKVTNLRYTDVITLWQRKRTKETLEENERGE